MNLVSMAGRFTVENLSIYSMSKHAAISFSDGLRRETRKWGIKVSTIEPMVYKTPMAGSDYFTREVEKQWNESSDDVRQLYGQEYYENYKTRKDTLKVTTAGDNIYEVIDKMVDAIRNPDPKIRYVAIPGKKFHKIAIFLAQLLPLEVSDQMFAHKTTGAPKPAGLQQLVNEE